MRQAGELPVEFGIHEIRERRAHVVLDGAEHLIDARPIEQQVAVLGLASAVIAARTEPTSLARFATQATRGGKRAGLRIGIQRGGGKAVLRSGFFINLRAGNRGVAIREAVANKVNLRRAGFSTRASKRGYLLLYGPSVDQVFRTVKDAPVRWARYAPR